MTALPAPAAITGLMTQTEVAALFRVHPRTVLRWRHAGKLTTARTPGGQPRCYRLEVHALLRSRP
jgi:excisionase family DNA binding protein